MPSQDILEMAELIRAMRDSTSVPLDDVATQREIMEAQQSIHDIPQEIVSEDIYIGGRRLRMVRTPNARQDAALLYLHGGAYIMGSVDTHHELMCRLSRAARIGVAGIDYRLAPENRYPAAVEDSMLAYETLLSQGISSERIILAGDSAGGGLAMAILLALKEQARPLPGGAVLLSAWTDLTASGDSVRSRADADPMLRAEAIADTAAMYLDDCPADLPGASPLFGDLSGMPPLLIQVGEHEVLLSDSERLHEKALAAGVDSSLHVFPGAFHAFQMIPDLPETEEAVAEIASFIEKILNSANA